MRYLGESIEGLKLGEINMDMDIELDDESNLFVSSWADLFIYFDHQWLLLNDLPYLLFMFIISNLMISVAGNSFLILLLH